MKLPESHFRTHWVLIQVGRSFFELNRYQKVRYLAIFQLWLKHSQLQACEYFEKARQLDPYNMNGVEIYSTALWQLRQEVKLAFLAQQVRLFDLIGFKAPFAICF